MSIKVRCNDSYEDGFSIGKVYELKDGKIIDDDNEARPMNDKTIDSFDKLCEYYDGCDFELLEFTLEDLKPFMLVERRNGERLLVGQSSKGVCLLNASLESVCLFSECSYNQDLTHLENANKDIVVVYDFCNSIHGTTSFSTEQRKTVWKKYDIVHLSLKTIKDKFNLEEDTVVIIE